MFKARALLIYFIMAAAVSAVGGKLFYIQVVKGAEFSRQSRIQSTRRTMLLAERGAIRDRNGNILAESIPETIRVDLRSIVDSEDSSEVEKDNRHISIKRVYPYGDVASTILGYTGRNGLGLAGVEYSFDELLRGEDGWAIKVQDGRNRKYGRIGMPSKLPVHGSDVYLTIDIRIQKIVKQVLKNTVDRLNAENGMAIVMDPESGEIIAMSSYPDFNPNLFQEYSAKRRQNRCVEYNYEPGSTFKVITASAAMQENIITPEILLDADQGQYKVYDEVIKDHEAFDTLTFRDALVHSSNVCFAKVADKLGNRFLYNYTKNFGFGERTGISLPGEEEGLVHPLEDWSGRTRVTMAMGQEVMSTFLQMVNSFTVICGDGVLRKPIICKEVVSSSKESILKGNSRPVRQVISEKVALKLRRILRGVVEEGTGTRASLPGLDIGGKTGTSQKVDPETGGYSEEDVWSSFIGFVPVEEVGLICGVLIDQPEEAEPGGIAAAPAFKSIVRRIVSMPELAYSDRILEYDHRKETDNAVVEHLPDFRGMARNNAVKLLQHQEVPYEFIGMGDTVRYQIPFGGNELNKGAHLTLYTDPELQDDGLNEEKDLVRVPNCVGKDLCDAINALNVKGIKPVISGAGIVEKQSPEVGVMVRRTSVCTLYCAGLTDRI